MLQHDVRCAGRRRSIAGTGESVGAKKNMPRDKKSKKSKKEKDKKDKKTDFKGETSDASSVEDERSDTATAPETEAAPGNMLPNPVPATASDRGVLDLSDEEGEAPEEPVVQHGASTRWHNTHTTRTHAHTRARVLVASAMIILQFSGNEMACPDLISATVPPPLSNGACRYCRVAGKIGDHNDWPGAAW